LASLKTSQIYLAEVSTLHNPKAEKLRAMRDSWINQIKATCRESVPCRGMSVFGSSSYKDETKLWRMEYKGVFRLMEFDTFLIPTKKHEFERNVKAAALSCIGLAARIEMESNRRSSNILTGNIWN
jgi:hypothetical protein